MSTKTVRKRVALATVVALGAGVLSLVSVTSANAVDNAQKISSSSTNKTSGYVVSTLYLSPYNSTTATATALGEGITPSTTNPASVGLLNVSDTVGNDTPIAGTTGTAVLLSGGKLSVYEKTSGAVSDSIVVTGATISLPAGTANIVVNSTSTAAQETSASSAYWGVIVTPNAGVSSFTVALYTSNTAGIANATTGTLSGYYTVSVSSAASSGTVSATKSGVLYETGTAGNPATWAISTSSVTGGKNDSNASTTGTSSYGNIQAALVTLKDAYSVNLSSGGYVTATATNGAYIGWTNSGSTPATTQSSTATAGTGYFAIDSTASTNGYVHMLVSAPSSAPMSTTVTVSVNGVVIGTKAFTFTGKVAKVVLSGPSNGYLSASTNTVSAYFYDAAGNAVAPGNTSSIGYASYPLQLTQNANTAGIGVGLGAYSSWASTTPTINFKCGASSATGNLAVDYTNPDGTVVTSNGVAVTCSDSPVAYTAKLDKSTYNPGDIATLTVTFKDKNGALAADRAATYTSATVPSIYGSNLTATSGSSTTAGTTSDATTNGVITYKFIVGTTSGSYALLADFPTVDTAATNAGLTQTAQTVAYSIASSGTSLNDVLKGIVSLIASINKQIAALAKLVTKK